MKKIIIFLSLFIFTCNIQAKEFTKVERIKHMRLLTSSLHKIQEGLTGTCQTCVEDGVDELQNNLSVLDSLEIKDFLPKEQAYAHKFAQKMAHNLKIYSNALKDAWREKKHFEAIDMYGLTINQCVSCHLRIRDWEKLK